MYIQETRYDKLTFRINDTAMTDWYADAAFMAYTDTKVHTRGVLTMGKGSIKNYFSEAKYQYKNFYIIIIGSSE